MAENIKLTIIHNNDIHGDFLPKEEDGIEKGGISLLSGYVQEQREKNDNVIYAMAGDMFRGSVIDSEYKGLSTIELMNRLMPDVVTIGNHEVDYGLAHLLFIEKCARFPIINANLFIKTNHVRLFNPYREIEKGGIKVLFIGIITDEILASTKGEDIIGSFVDVRAVADEIKVICDTYKTMDTNYTVILSHIGYDKDQELAALLPPEYGVDLIIGGHTHTLLEEPTVVNGIPIVQAGSGSGQIGRWEVEFDPVSREPVNYKWTVDPIDSNTCKHDREVETLLSAYKNETDEKYMAVLTNFRRTLTHPARNMETELGDLFADVMQADSSFDIMVLGSGSLRLPELGPILHLQDLREFFPFDDPLHLVEVTGAQLRRMIAYVMRDEYLTGHTEFYQYSKDFRFVWSQSAHEFKSFTYKGKEITDDQRLKLGLQGYHFNNFESSFNVPISEVAHNRQPRIIAQSCLSIYEELFANMRNVDSHVDGRITVVD
ncbi:MAG: bifunctional metallophosphatase/5'-nucleotidase [Lachnospiraceae bacterium]|nr:bifunctional metallophosphatase/5'-nucleotidase [Lachnospiraceae bacterium]